MPEGPAMPACLRSPGCVISDWRGGLDRSQECARRPPFVPSWPVPRRRNGGASRWSWWYARARRPVVQPSSAAARGALLAEREGPAGSENLPQKLRTFRATAASRRPPPADPAARYRTPSSTLHAPGESGLGREQAARGAEVAVGEAHVWRRGRSRVRDARALHRVRMRRGVAAAAVDAAAAAVCVWLLRQV